MTHELSAGPTLDPRTQVKIFNETSQQYIVSNPAGSHWIVSPNCGRFLLLLDGSRTLEELDRELMHESWGELHRCSSAEVLEQLAGRTGSLLGSAAEPAPRNRFRGKGALLSVDLFPAEKLSAIAVRLGFLMKGSVASVLTLLSVIAVGMAFVHLRATPSLSHLHLPLFAVVVAIVCSGPIHELGHVVASEYFGVTPGEIGFGLYRAMPVMYVDLSHIWKLDRIPRIVVNLSGMYFQLLAAGVLSGMGLLLHSTVMLLAGVGYCLASLANINPLMRMDGYWCLSDWLQVPNLRQEGRRALWLSIKSGLQSGSAREEARYSSWVVLYGLFHIGFLLLFIAAGVRSLVATAEFVRLYHGAIFSILFSGQILFTMQILARFAFGLGVMVVLIKLAADLFQKGRSRFLQGEAA